MSENRNMLTRMTLFNILVQWHGLHPADDGFVHHSIAEFSL